MPKGKGTYGSKVGRPPKKEYQVGGEVGMNADPFSTKNVFGVPAEEAMKEMNKKNVMKGIKKTAQELGPNDVQNAPPGSPPTANAQERSQTFQVGGNVLEYKEGGPVGPAGDPRYAPKKGQKSTLMRNKPKEKKKSSAFQEAYRREYDKILSGKKTVKDGSLARKKKVKSKSQNITALDLPKVRKELKQVDPKRKTSRKAKKHFKDDSGNLA